MCVVDDGGARPGLNRRIVRRELRAAAGEDAAQGVLKRPLRLGRKGVELHLEPERSAGEPLQLLLGGNDADPEETNQRRDECRDRARQSQRIG